MKTAAVYRPVRSAHPQIPYPNAASRRQILAKAVDFLLMAASGAGAAAIVLFLLALA